MKPGDRWFHTKAKRPVVIVADRGTHIDFHYVQGLGGTQLFRRGVTPTQTLPRAEFEKFCHEQAPTKETTQTRNRRG